MIEFLLKINKNSSSNSAEVQIPTSAFDYYSLKKSELIRILIIFSTYNDGIICLFLVTIMEMGYIGIEKSFKLKTM
ncbi:hypothetical protein BpHYR1_022503 [Brachionus plicatilis]|uniref:Uncharacterized protein n=1 Tax=Brachionus plicatilis TaxID=10195 RepID=A0A3M7R3J6_BRAPC|nr:hypothetical protein BpHYR1_022503 [Brachionus plicatilis]